MPFNIGAGELILLAAVALMLFGPRRLPEIGKAVGEGLASFKKAVNGLSEPVQSLALPNARTAVPAAPAVPEADPAPAGSVASSSLAPAPPTSEEAKA